jgi:methyl-accepting chemotaxis protein
MLNQFVLTIVLCVGLTTLGFVTYYWLSYIAGANLLREFIVVYEQGERLESVEVDGRTVERRSYVTEALPQTTRWALILPPLLLNNAVIVTVLVVMAFGYSSHYAGPVYRMSIDIRRVLAGETGVRINLRRGDEMRELALRVNALLEALEHAESRARDG